MHLQISPQKHTDLKVYEKMILWEAACHTGDGWLVYGNRLIVRIIGLRPPSFVSFLKRGDDQGTHSVGE